MDEVCRSGKMDQGMMDSGKMAWHMDWVDQYTLKAIYTRVNGLKIRLMVTASNKTLKEADTKETGKMINKMEKELKNGLMVLYMKANIKME